MKKDNTIKQLEKANEKMKKTVGNMKKLSASNKKAQHGATKFQQEAAKAQQKITALEAILGGGQADVQLFGPMLAAAGMLQGLSPEPQSKSTKAERKKHAETQTKPARPAKPVSLDPGDL